MSDEMTRTPGSVESGVLLCRWTRSKCNEPAIPGHRRKLCRAHLSEDQAERDRKRRAGPTLRIDLCRICGDQIEWTTGKGAPRKYCSDRCVAEAERRRQRKPPQEHFPTSLGTCECGTSFEWTPGKGAPRLYCSEPCSRRAQILRQAAGLS